MLFKMVSNKIVFVLFKMGFPDKGYTNENKNVYIQKYGLESIITNRKIFYIRERWNFFDKRCFTFLIFLKEGPITFL